MIAYTAHVHEYPLLVQDAKRDAAAFRTGEPFPLALDPLPDRLKPPVGGIPRLPQGFRGSERLFQLRFALIWSRGSELRTRRRFLRIRLNCRLVAFGIERAHRAPSFRSSQSVCWACQSHHDDE